MRLNPSQDGQFATHSERSDHCLGGLQGLDEDGKWRMVILLLVLLTGMLVIDVRWPVFISFD